MSRHRLGACRDLPFAASGVGVGVLKAPPMPHQDAIPRPREASGFPPLWAALLDRIRGSPGRLRASGAGVVTAGLPGLAAGRSWQGAGAFAGPEWQQAASPPASA